MERSDIACGNGQQPELRREGRDCLEPVRRRVNPTTTRNVIAPRKAQPEIPAGIF